jgi:hypothetical protein
MMNKGKDVCMMNKGKDEKPFGYASFHIRYFYFYPTTCIFTQGGLEPEAARDCALMFKVTAWKKKSLLE